MGTTFKHISDAALREEDGSYYKLCHACGAENVALYKAQGFLLSSDGTFDEDDPDSEIHVACAGCIRQQKIARFGEYETDVFLRANFDNWMDLRAALRCTPQIPLMLQRDDWPICCRDICEFTGCPTELDELIQFVDRATYWARGLGGFARNFRDSGPPESFREISKFSCLQCGRQYWTDQFT